MNREYAKREKREMIKLVVISILVVLIYLAVSFQDVYGYHFSGFYNYTHDNNQAIQWNSDRWMNSPAGGDNFTYDFQDRFAGLPSGDQNHPSQNYDLDSDASSADSFPTIPEPGIIILVALGLSGFQIARKLLR